jgi:Spondin_N
MKTTALLVASIIGVTFAASEVFADDTGPARYRVTITGQWTPANHPLDYPVNAHFSKAIGVSHNGAYKLFAAGGIATAGLKALAEKGDVLPIEQEVKAAIAAGNAGKVAIAEPVAKMPGEVSFEIGVDGTNAAVSVATMLAPSPDWFAGVANVNLRNGREWVAQETVTVYAWDAGTDAGMTYTAPDAEMLPRAPVMISAAPQFLQGGRPIAVGTIKFVKQ